MPPRRSPWAATLAERLECFSIPEPNSGCTLWIGSVTGTMRYGKVSWKGKQRVAHRMAWELRHGPIPKGLYVCHRCDVPLCINADHLFLGTRADNARDMREKGRGYILTAIRGEANPRAKLTEAQVRAIRAMADRPRADVAREFGISGVNVLQIVKRMTWRHVI
jgi:hypothetical protein